jgi:uncharacterized protein (TIGR02217 family)
MSNAVLPTLRGLKWDIKRRPIFNTIVQSAVSGRETRVALMSAPLWQWDIAFDVLRSAAAYQDFQKLLGFFLSRQGRFDTFLYTDPDDSAVTDQQFGIRDGVATQFQLTRAFGAGGFTFVEPVQNVNVLTNIKSNGSAIANPADYTISSAGLVTLAVPGTAGHALTWTGSYYWRVRPVDDSIEFNNFMANLWELQKFSLVSVKL